MVDDWHRVIHVSVEPLFKALKVVVSSATSSLSSLQTPLNALVRRTFKEKNKKEVDLVRHLFLPALQVVFVAGEAIDEEFIVASFL